MSIDVPFLLTADSTSEFSARFSAVPRVRIFPLLHVRADARPVRGRVLFPE